MTEISIKIPAPTKPSGKAAMVMLGTGFDEIEALAPVDVMRRAGMEVYTVSMTENRIVRGATGNLMVYDTTISEITTEMVDWLIFPGADKSEDAVNLAEEVQTFVRGHWDKDGRIAAICAAPALVLGPIGIIDGIVATGYPFLKEEFEKHGGRYCSEDVVVSDRLITSQGPGTTIEFAMAIVRATKGEETERALREGMVIADTQN